MKWAGLLLAVLVASGCASRGKAKLGNLSVTPPANAEAASVLSNGVKSETVTIPAGSTVTVTETPANGQETAKRVTEYVFAADSVQTRAEEMAKVEVAAPRAPDTSVDMYKADLAERRWLLWASIGAGLAGIVIRSLLPAWPGLSNGLLAASGIAFAAWKFSEIPAWLFLVAIGIMVFIALGYKKGEKDANGNGIPDHLEGKEKAS